MIPYEFDTERFSRWMAYVLRHNPLRYGLQPDRHGYVDGETFLLMAQRRYPALTADRLRHLIASSEVERFEMVGNRLRARYGHSIQVEPPGPPCEPPARLYYGAAAAHTESILASGLKPTDRRLLHLSETFEAAAALARRKTEQPVVVRVQAQEAHRVGLVFYREGRVFLTSHVPAAFLSFESWPTSSPAPSSDPTVFPTDSSLRERSQPPHESP